MFDISRGSFFKHAGERRLLLADLCSTGPVLRADIFFRDLQAVLLRQVFDRFDEGHAGVLHQEADGVAIFTATKAVVELFGRAD